MKSLVVAVLTLMTVGQCFSDEIQRYLIETDIAVRAKDSARVKKLIFELNQKELWTMGGGLGPVTNESLQFNLVVFSHDFLFDSKGRFQTQCRQVNESSELCAAFTVSPDNLVEIKKLLGSTNPAVRFICLFKLSKGELGPQSKKLFETVAQSDSYSVITRQMTADPEERLSLGPSEYLFVCPLRGYAEEMLSNLYKKTNGHKGGLDETIVGILNLWDTYIQYPDRRGSIEIAIQRVSDRPSVLSALNSLEIKSEHRLLFNALLAKLAGNG